MNSVVVSKEKTTIIDLGAKKFYKYTSPTNTFEVKKTVLKGRSPEDSSKAYRESKPFALYILTGNGSIILDGKITALRPEDVVYVLENTKWAIEGNLEYIVFNTPVWTPDQMEEVDSDTA